MKRITTLLLFLCIATMALMAKTYVIAAGVAGYANANQLDYPAQDAKLVAQALKDAGCSVILLTTDKAKHDNIIQAIRNVAKKAGPKDRVIFFFSGHGAEGCLLTYDDPSLRNTYLYYSTLLDELAKLKAGQTAVFINSCHSGSMETTITDKGDWRNKAQNNKIVLMLSSEADEYTWESNWSSGGYFTRSLINCLHGLCDANKDNRITYQEMYNYIYNDVVSRSNGKQHPVLLYGPGMQNAVFMKW